MFTMKSLPVLALVMFAAACDGQMDPAHQPNVLSFGGNTVSTIADVDGTSSVLGSEQAPKIGTLRWNNGPVAGLTRIQVDAGGVLPGSLSISVGDEGMTASLASAALSVLWNQVHATVATGQLMTMHDCVAPAFGDDDDCDSVAPRPSAVCRPSTACESFTVDGQLWSECIELATDCTTATTVRSTDAHE